MKNVIRPFDPDFNVFEIIGQVVSIRAILVIVDVHCYLVGSRDEVGSLNRVDVFFPGLERILDRSVGGWVGWWSCIVS